MAETDKIYNHFKQHKNSKFQEKKHCKILIEVMSHPDTATKYDFCIHPEVMISEKTFKNWVNAYPIFRELYSYSKMRARVAWEKEGRRIRDQDYPMGVINYAFEHWKMIGWSHFGISRTSKIEIIAKENSTPMELYNSILSQAAEGDFTASEFKQLMEAVNIGLNVHETTELQKQIDELKSSLSIMEQNSNVQNPFTNKGIEQKNQDSMEDSVRE